eukprot:6179944-Pleurochrysis_carterae.AAC.1
MRKRCPACCKRGPLRLSAAQHQCMRKLSISDHVSGGGTLSSSWELESTSRFLEAAPWTPHDQQVRGKFASWSYCQSFRCS